MTEPIPPALMLVALDGSTAVPLASDLPQVVGRAAPADIEIAHPTISRVHAELSCADGQVRVRDLGSRNGTYVDGVRVDDATLVPGATVAFGAMSFQLVEATTPEAAPPPATAAAGTARLAIVPAAAVSVVWERRVREDAGLVASALQAPTEAADGLATVQQSARTAKRLALLVEVSKGLTRVADLDALLDTIAEYVFQVMDADWAAILLADAQGALVPRVTRDAGGDRHARAVPQSIASRVLHEQVAVLTHNAAVDDRFGGGSIVRQGVRSAICVPLVGSEPRPHGVLYVDNRTATHRFTEDDLDFLVAFAGIAAVAIEHSLFTERMRRQALVRSNFERYFAPSLAARIAAATDSLRLGGERQRVAILFSDVRGFTALAESMAPDAMARLMSEYFTAMVDCVFRHGGTLDKFIGDALLAQWGAPLGAVDDADRAMHAALDMLRTLDALNAQWRAQGGPELHIGIGLSYGEVFAGNIGSERRLEFTVIGDAVNLAARLCAAARPGEILLSDAMRHALTSPPALVDLPPMHLKGRASATPVFGVVVEPDARHGAP